MRIDGFSGRLVEVNYVGGALPYLWLGVDDRAIGTIDKTQQLRQLIRWANKIIEKRMQYPTKENT